jgi:hypothetical protein
MAVFKLLVITIAEISFRASKMAGYFLTALAAIVL